MYLIYVSARSNHGLFSTDELAFVLKLYPEWIVSLTIAVL